MGHTEVKVAEIPGCDFCAQGGVRRRAGYDGKTIIGPWANMCEEHFKAFGVGLGLGRGQRLVREHKNKDADAEADAQAMVDAQDQVEDDYWQDR